MNDRPILSLVSEVTSAEATFLPPVEPEKPPSPYRHGFSWLVQMRDGRVLRVDADRVDTYNGVLTFFGGPRSELLLAAFEYGDWKRVGIMDRDTGANDAWTVMRERQDKRR